MKFGDNLKNLRKSKKYSQEELAEKVNVSRQSVSKWETGEAYPEMNNLLELCKIFKCRINDLVNDSILDIDSLDEKTKIEVGKLKEEDQKKVKGLSKSIFIIARISKILIMLAIGILLISSILTNILLANVRINNNEIRLKNAIVILNEEEKSVELEVFEERAKIDNYYVFEEVHEFYTKNNKVSIIIFVNFCMISLLICLVLIIKVLTHLDKLFTNIYCGDTPFTLDNVAHIKNMAKVMITIILASNVLSLVAEFIIHVDLNIGFEMFDLIEILFLFSLAYIFEYGYYIQKDSKSTIYES